MKKLAEHQRLALWTPLQGAAVFETVSSSVPDVLLLKWLPDVDSHHDARLNRPTGYFTSQGILKMVDEDGNAPSPAGCSASRDSAKSCGAEQ